MVDADDDADMLVLDPIRTTHGPRRPGLLAGLGRLLRHRRSPDLAFIAEVRRRRDDVREETIQAMVAMRLAEKRLYRWRAELTIARIGAEHARDTGRLLDLEEARAREGDSQHWVRLDTEEVRARREAGEALTGKLLDLDAELYELEP